MNRFRFSTNLARVIAGGGIFTLTATVLWMIYTKPDLADNDLFAMLAQAIIIQGLIGLVMAFLFTGKNSGEHPSQVEVVNPPESPVPVESKEGG